MIAKGDNFENKKLNLLKRWADAPEYSPLSRAPDLSDFLEELESTDEDVDEPDFSLLLTSNNDGGKSDPILMRTLHEEIEEFEKRRLEKKAEEENRIIEAMVGRVREWFLENRSRVRLSGIHLGRAL